MVCSTSSRTTRTSRTSKSRAFSSDARRYASLPHRPFSSSSARLEVSAPNPPVATLMKNRSPTPSERTLATSRTLTRFSLTTFSASSILAGMASVAARSLPVPMGRTARVTPSGKPALPRPFTASFRVPSPPTTMSRPSPHSLAASRASPEPSVSIHSMSRSPNASRTVPGSHPPPEAGLQITRALVFELSMGLVALRRLHTLGVYPEATVNIAAGTTLGGAKAEVVGGGEARKDLDRQPHLAPGPAVELDGGILAVLGDVADLARAHRGLDLLPDRQLP